MFEIIKRLRVVRDVLRSEYGDTVAVGFPVDRKDGLTSLHVGGSHTYLDDLECKRVASMLLNRSACDHFWCTTDFPIERGQVASVCIFCAAPRFKP